MGEDVVRRKGCQSEVRLQVNQSLLPHDEADSQGGSTVTVRHNPKVEQRDVCSATANLSRTCWPQWTGKRGCHTNSASSNGKLLACEKSACEEIWGFYRRSSLIQIRPFRTHYQNLSSKLRDVKMKGTPAKLRRPVDPSSENGIFFTISNFSHRHPSSFSIWNENGCCVPTLNAQRILPLSQKGSAGSDDPNHSFARVHSCSQSAGWMMVESDRPCETGRLRRDGCERQTSFKGRSERGEGGSACRAIRILLDEDLRVRVRPQARTDSTLPHLLVR